MTNVRTSQKLASLARLAGAWARRPQALPEKWLYSLGLRSARGLRMPDFLGIGAQKAGTTWLHQNLREHPELYFPPRKELRYFDARFHLSPAQYAACFEPAGRRVSGDITPGYATLRPARIRFVRTLMPDVKLVAILRNPVDRAWSHALMDLVDRTGRAYEEVEPWEFRAHFEARGSLQHGRYRRMLDRWLAVFPAEQLLVAFFEDIGERPRELLRSVFRHIGVSSDVDWSRFPCERRIKPGVGVPLPPEYRARLWELFADEIDGLVQRFGAPAERWRDAAPRA